MASLGNDPWNRPQKPTNDAPASRAGSGCATDCPAPSRVGQVVADFDASAIAERSKSWWPNYRPRTRAEQWMFDLIIHASVRIDRCQRLEPAIRRVHARRARLFWEADRRHEAEELAATLSKNPEAVACKLNMTKQGAEWMLDRWYELGVALGPRESRREEPGQPVACAWNADQIALAHDLLGVPEAFRTGKPWKAVNEETPGALVKTQILALEQRCAGTLKDLDALDRDAAIHGLSLGTLAELTAIRKYEDSCMRKLMWAHRHFERGTTEVAYRTEMDRNLLAESKTRTRSRPAAKPLTLVSLARKNVERMSHDEREIWYHQVDQVLFLDWVRDHLTELSSRD